MPSVVFSRSPHIYFNQGPNAGSVCPLPALDLRCGLRVRSIVRGGFGRGSVLLPVSWLRPQ